MGVNSKLLVKIQKQYDFAEAKKKKIEHLIYGDHNYGARRAPRPPEGNHWHPEGGHS